jgi:hypothetical protein
LLQDTIVTVTNSSNNATIQNYFQQEILALQQVRGSLQQTLMGLQQSAPQDRNVTIFSDNNNSNTAT